MVCPGGACAGQAGGWRSLAGTGKSLSHPLAGDCAEATAFPPGDKSGHRVAVETEAPAGRQREAGQQAELPLAFLHRRVVRAERPVPADVCSGNSERYALELPSAERSGMVRPKCCGAQCGRERHLSLTGQPRCRF
uniref:Uncharacterized protein n=1 Tax=Citrobacter freundii TaxID=546 RepID=A0A222ZE53_CITFR|nr:Hypothetical protein [Citrobacter freundii]